MSATNVAHAGKHGNICVPNNVSSFATAFTKARRDSFMFIKTLSCDCYGKHYKKHTIQDKFSSPRQSVEING